MRFLVFVFLVLLLTTSCKKNSEDENSLCFTRTATYLKIENNTNKVVYISSFGQNILPLIDWVPTCGNNHVQPNSSISQEFSSIPGYADNDKLVVYWWECTDGHVKQIRNVILDINQTTCP